MTALASLPKKRFESADSAIPKCRAMIRCGKADDYISDYLGMTIVQVREIRNNTPRNKQGRPARVPTRVFATPEMTDRGNRRNMSLERNAATFGSQELRVGLLRYGVKNGLPNLSSLQCLSELRTLGLVRDEELILADKIERELQRPSPLSRMDEQ